LLLSSAKGIAALGPVVVDCGVSEYVCWGKFGMRFDFRCAGNAAALLGGIFLLYFGLDEDVIKKVIGKKDAREDGK